MKQECTLKVICLPTLLPLMLYPSFLKQHTALGVKLDENDNVILTAPCGISDVINLEVKPTPYFTETKERVEIYEERITKKNWKLTWNKFNVYHINRT